MRRLLLLFLVTLFTGAPITANAQAPALIAGGLTAQPVTTLGPNLAVNGSFETVSSSVPTSWTTGTAWAVDQLVKHSGTHSYRRGTGSLTATQTVAVKAGTYLLSGWIKTQSIAGTNAGVRLSLDSRPTYNEWTTSNVIAGTHDWLPVQIGPIVITTDRTVKIELEMYNVPSGTAWFDDVVLQQQLPHPLDVFMLYPNFRGMLFDDQPQAMTFDVGVTPPSGIASSYTVKATLAVESSGVVIATQSFAGAPDLQATLDGSAMQPGISYLVTFSLVDATGKTVGSYPAYRVSKVPGSAKATMNIAYDEKNHVLVHGTPRFVLGVYDSGLSYSTDPTYWETTLWSSTGARRMSGLDINFYLNFWYGLADAASMNALMTNLQNHGVMYLQTGNCATATPAEPTNHFAIDTSDSYVQTLDAHPGLGGFYTADECKPSLVPGVFTQHQRLATLAPDTMTFSALFGNQHDLFLWRDAVDVVGTDPYPMYGAQPAGGYALSEVADWTSAARDAVHDARPYMTVLQFFKFTSLGRFPAYSELRNMAYTAITEGAHGLWWWSLGDGALVNVCSGWCTEKINHMSDLKTLVAEISALEPVLLADDAPTSLAGNSNSTAIRTKVKVVAGIGYLFAYNYTGATVPATFTWNSPVTSVTVNGESRTITPSSASFADTFAPYQAHVYVIGTTGTVVSGALSLSFANPANGSTVTGPATVTVTATGGSGSGYSYAVALDGRTVGTNSTGSFTLDSTRTMNGTHTVTATVTDSLGATATSSIMVLVAN